jgi:hypothetical protein
MIPIDSALRKLPQGGCLEDIALYKPVNGLKHTLPVSLFSRVYVYRQAGPCCNM